ncbi:MAG TPA: DUF6632 domain-containing protein [Candidatus Limnocylindrales bacterium]|nr:DUF6632 domain-containing protein [Candidatus Limnocylindrales bacterium]
MAVAKEKLDSSFGTAQGHASSGERVAQQPASTQYLKLALRAVGLIFTFGIYPLTIVWPSGWAWHASGHSHYLDMILGVYATLGIFLLIASRNPLEHRSLIWFAVWSSVVHGAIMAAQSLMNPEHIGHLWGDVLALFAVAALLAVLMQRSTVANTA